VWTGGKTDLFSLKMPHTVFIRERNNGSKEIYLFSNTGNVKLTLKKCTLRTSTFSGQN